MHACELQVPLGTTGEEILEQTHSLKSFKRHRMSAAGCDELVAMASSVGASSSLLSTTESRLKPFLREVSLSLRTCVGTKRATCAK